MRTLEQLLVSGSDARLTVDPKTGFNRFGCAPEPRPDAFSFSSSTASTISPEAFRRVQNEYENLRRAACPKRHLDAQMEMQRQELKGLLGLAETGTEIVFSPSGTDSTLHALSLIRALTGGVPLDCILPASDETGSGVPMALKGRHFSDRTSAGMSVTPGESIAGLGDGVTLISLPRRSADGALQLRLDQDVWDAVARSAGAGRPVLLQVMDCSKLGAASPSAECLRRIHARFAGSVHFVVDTCQMRLSRERLQEHLAQGHLVLISGSKFFAGPPFSGALLVPASLAARIGNTSFAAPELRDYTSRSAWPQTWTALRAALPDRPNFGQYFRWTAALTEMQAYFSVPCEFRRQVLEQFAAMVTTLIQSCPAHFLLLENESESLARTIFPFLVRQGSGWMSFADMAALYQALTAEHCHVGQPVRVPLGRGKDAGALRISADARLVSHLWAEYCANPRSDPPSSGLARQEREICTILGRIAKWPGHQTVELNE